MAYCDCCLRWFQDNRALQQHMENSNYHWVCDDCDLDFPRWNGLREHYIQSRKHYYCGECNCHFSSNRARVQHMVDEHWYCRTHDKVFRSESGLLSHYNQSPNHHFCPKCGDDFFDVGDLWEHADEDHYPCRQCREIFGSHSELQSHDRDVHTYCTDCHLSFHSESNLRHHLNSRVHQPANVRCPDRGCNRSFVSHAALVLHFESGTCPSKMTREQLNRLVVRADTNNYITNPARLLTGPQGHYSPPAPTRTWATERSWNVWAYQCFLCNSTFETLARLNQHLQSPRHEEKIYRCPKSDCSMQFVALSGLCQHVEGGSCGVWMFRPVRDVMENLTRSFNTLTM